MLSAIMDSLLKNVYLRILKILQIPLFHNVFLIQLGTPGCTLGVRFSCSKSPMSSVNHGFEIKVVTTSPPRAKRAAEGLTPRQSNQAEPQPDHLSGLKDDTHRSPRETATQRLLSRSIHCVGFFFSLSKK